MNGKENNEKIPEALATALAHNIGALRVFANLPDHKRAPIINGASSLRSKKEMKSYVAEIKKMNDTIM